MKSIGKLEMQMVETRLRMNWLLYSVNWKSYGSEQNGQM